MSTIAPTPEPTTEAHPAASYRIDARQWLRRERDLFVASDPGMNRLINALGAGMTIGAILGVVYLFEQWTHLLWVSAPAGVQLSATQQTALDAQHHGITVLMMLLGGIVGMLSSNLVQDPTARGQALSIVLMPIPMVGSLALALWLAPHHWVGVIVMALVMGFGVWLRRYVPQVGPRAVLYGALLFIGYMIGFLSQGELTEGNDLWQVAIVLLVAGAVAFVIKVGYANPLARGRLARTSRAFRARCRGVLAATVVVFDAEPGGELSRARRRLHRSLGRLNETALLIDAALAQADPVELGEDAGVIQDELFALELLVQNIARVSERLALADLAPELRTQIRGWLDEIRTGHIERAGASTRAFQEHHLIEQVDGLSPEDAGRVRRLAMTIRQAADMAAELPTERHSDTAVHADPFSSPVTLMFGDLPGSALLARQVAARDENLPWWRRLDQASQGAVRMAVAVGAAGLIASAISERRFYWAVIAVFITFMGTNTSGEQLVKSVSRVGGTVIGILIGSLIAQAIGVSTWSIAVVLVSMTAAMYFIKTSYGIAVIGITITVSQLYEQLGEFSDSLLLLRLAETGVGAAVAMVAALVIFPIPTRRVVSLAASGYVRALEQVLEHIQNRLVSGDGHERLTGSVRAMDFAASQLSAASRPLRYTPFKPQHLEYNVALLSQTAHQAHNIAAEIQAHPSFAPLPDDALVSIVDTERHAVCALVDAISSGTPGSDEHRVPDSEIGRLDKILRDADVSRDGYQRRLLFLLDRLDETVAELRANIASLADAAPARLETTASDPASG